MLMTIYSFCISLQRMRVKLEEKKAALKWQLPHFVWFWGFEMFITMVLLMAMKMHCIGWFRNTAIFAYHDSAQYLKYLGGKFILNNIWDVKTSNFDLSMKFSYRKTGKIHLKKGKISLWWTHSYLTDISLHMPLKCVYSANRCIFALLIICTSNGMISLVQISAR